MDRTSATSVGQEVAPLRCTVFARTSSHEVEGQAYTSIDAQLDAGLAYITSQAGVGWQFTGTAYSDAEVSGAVLERPGLQRLMTAIDAGAAAFRPWGMCSMASVCSSRKMRPRWCAPSSSAS